MRAARSFYTKNGFVEDGIRQGFYVNPSEDAVLMSRTVGGRCLMDFKRMLIESLKCPEAVPSRNCGDIRYNVGVAKRKSENHRRKFYAASMN